MELNHSAAHKFVREQRRKGKDVRWENYDIVFWRPSIHGFTSTSGAFRRGRWGIETRIKVNEAGIWNIPRRNVSSR